MQYLNLIIVALVSLTIIFFVFKKIKHKQAEKITQEEFSTPSLGDSHYEDGIIAVRKQGEWEKPIEKNSVQCPETGEIITLHVVAKENKTFAGYELLQALLSSGLRFGEMNIFHYYGNEPQKALFSLLSATEPGIFDMPNIGAFSCKGLTLFMKRSDDTQDNNNRYALMLKTARHLSEDLHGLLLNSQKQLAE